MPSMTWKCARTLIVCLHVAQMVATSVVRLSDAHRVVGEVDIAVVALRTVSLIRN